MGAGRGAPVLLDVVNHIQRAILQVRGFRSSYVHTSVGRVHVLDADGPGSGPPMLVLHGIAESGVAFADVLPSLLRRCRRVVAPDLPGHGFSDVPSGGMRAEVLRVGLLEALDPYLDEPFVVLGNSLGGVGAVRLWQARPHRVRALLLNSPGGAYEDEQSLRRFVSRFAFRTDDDVLAFMARLFVEPPWYRRLIVPSVRKRFGSPHLRALLASLGSGDLLRADEVAKIDCPVMLLWGKDDRLMPETHLSFWKAHLPAHARIEEPDRFGHVPHVDSPRRLLGHVYDFLEKIS
jgi:pimeloyl-ACP methyl ester carboxylesterase